MLFSEFGLVHPTLRLGSSGPEVVTLQTALTARGFNLGTIDGKFGPATLAAVKLYQTALGLKVDGVVGPDTWAALEGAQTSAGVASNTGAMPMIPARLTTKSNLPIKILGASNTNTTIDNTNLMVDGGYLPPSLPVTVAGFPWPVIGAGVAVVLGAALYFTRK